MADYNSSYKGSEIDSAVGKAHDAITVEDTDTLDLTLTEQEIKGDVLAIKNSNLGETTITFIKLYTISQEEYDALETPDAKTLYIITS